MCLYCHLAVEKPCLDTDVHVDGKLVNCSSFLRPEDSYLYYNKRKEYCSKREIASKCCASCQIVKRGDCEESLGVFLEKHTYPCVYLRYKFSKDTLGIYENRVTICKDPGTKCCLTCFFYVPKKVGVIVNTSFVLLSIPQFQLYTC